MKLGTFEIGAGKRLGAFENKWVIDLNPAYRTLLIEKGMSDPEARADSQLPIDLFSFIEKNEIAFSAAEKTLDYVRTKDYQVAGCLHPLSQITFRASHRPPKIVCTGTNHEEYRRPIGVPFSPVPLVFLKSPSAAAFKAGDVLRGEIQRIGVLRNPVEGIEANSKYAQQIDLEDIV